MDTSRYDAAVDRNLAELQRSILNRQAMVAMESVGISDGYLKVIYYALFNDYIAHCIKVLERSKGAASFWYVYETNQKPIDDFARRNRIDLSKLGAMTAKLKHVRDKTHFHIDREGVLDTKSVWNEAGLNGKDLSDAVDQMWELLNVVRRSIGKKPMAIPPYDVEAVRRLTILVEEGGLSK